MSKKDDWDEGFEAGYKAREEELIQCEQQLQAYMSLEAARNRVERNKDINP